jgi:hypothetical protein
LDPTVVVDEGDAADTVAACDEEEDAHADAPLVADAPPDRVALAVEQREDEDVAQPDGAGLDDADPQLVEEPPELTDAPPLDDPVAVEPTDDDNVAVAPPLVDDVPDADCAAVAVASPERNADDELVDVKDKVADAMADTVASPLAETNAVSVADSVPVADTHAVGRVDTEPKPLGVEHALLNADDDAPFDADMPPDGVALAVEQREDEDVAQPDGAGLDDADPQPVEEPPELTDAPPLDDSVAVEPPEDDGAAVAPLLVNADPDADCAADAVVSPEGNVDDELVTVKDEVAHALADTVTPLAETNADGVAVFDGVATGVDEAH